MVLPRENRFGETRPDDCGPLAGVRIDAVRLNASLNSRTDKVIDHQT